MNNLEAMPTAVCANATTGGNEVLLYQDASRSSLTMLQQFLSI